VGLASTVPGVPAYVDSTLDLPPIYRVHQLRNTTQEIASGGGRYEAGEMVVGPITPAFTWPDGTRGGFRELDLKPLARTGTEIVYVLSGAHAGEYTLRELRSAKPFSYEVVLARRQTTP
jgi:hypothetical protein